MLGDGDLNYVLVNSRYSELYEFPDGLVKVGGNLHDELRFQADRGDFGPGDKDELIESVAATYRKGEAVSYEREIAGSGRTLNVRLAPTPEGGTITIATDITERKRAAEELAEKEAVLRLALDHMPGGMFLVDNERRILLVNQQYSDLFRFPDGLLVEGQDLNAALKYQAERGDFGDSDDTDALVEDVGSMRDGSLRTYERHLASGKTLQIHLAPTPAGGTISVATDITERKRAEQELAEKEAQLRTVLDNMSDGIFMLDSELRYIFFNDHYLELLELSEGIVSTGKPIFEVNLALAKNGFYGDGDPETHARERTRYYSETEFSERELELQSGRVLHYRKVLIESGRTVVTVHDITEHKRAAEEIAEKEALLRLALDNMPGGLAVYDGEFNFVVVNDWIKDYYGAPEGLMEGGQPMEGLVRFLASQGVLGPGDVDDLVKERFESLEKREIAVSEHVMPDGRTLQLRRQPLEDGGDAVIYVDITEIKQAEKALSDQLKFVDALVETIPNPVFVKDTETRYKILNQAWLDAWGVRREDLIGKTVLEFEKMPMEQRESLQKQAEELLANGGGSHRETSRSLADGRVHDVLYWETAIELSEGNIGGLVGVFVDISEQKALERELADAKGAAETATQAKSQFLANMSHELRTPMNAIIGFSRIVMRRAKSDLAPKQFANLEKIYASAEHLLALINDILDLSKIEAGQMIVYPVDFDLASLIDDCLGTVAPLVQSDKVRLIQQVESDLPTIFNDPDKVRQILINLLSNAIKFTEAGSVTVSVASRGETIAIEVTDTGVGIHEDALQLIFEQFRQADDSSTRRHGGTGLGLAITRHLALLLGGDIGVESTLGAGSSFRVSFLQRYRDADERAPA